MAERADAYCAECFGRQHDGDEDHEFITAYDTTCQSDVWCPWCGAKNSDDDTTPGERRDCEACGKPFSIDVDYDPSYTTSKIQCHACGGEITQQFWTKLGRPSCSAACRDACNAKYDANEYPRSGFLAEAKS